jgi:hypothetical protein
MINDECMAHKCAQVLKDIYYIFIHLVHSLISCFKVV